MNHKLPACNLDLTESEGLILIGKMLGHCAIQKGCVFVGMARFLVDLFAGEELDVNKIEIEDIPDFDMQAPIAKVKRLN